MVHIAICGQHGLIDADVPCGLLLAWVVELRGAVELAEATAGVADVSDAGKGLVEVLSIAVQGASKIDAFGALLDFIQMRGKLQQCGFVPTSEQGGTRLPNAGGITAKQFREEWNWCRHRHCI